MGSQGADCGELVTLIGIHLKLSEHGLCHRIGRTVGKTMGGQTNSCGFKFHSFYSLLSICSSIIRVEELMTMPVGNYMFKVSKITLEKCSILLTMDGQLPTWISQ